MPDKSATLQVTRAANTFDEPIDTAIAAKPNFANTSRKAMILFAAGRNQEGIAVGEKAVAIGKADSTVKPADIAALEKRIADAKAAKK